MILNNENCLRQTHSQAFFYNHLNRIYCANLHLKERLPELLEQPGFKDLKHAITQSLKSVTKQINIIERIFSILKAKHNLSKLNNIIAYMEDSFTAIDQEEDICEMRDLSILSYMQNIAGILSGSLKVLEIIKSSIEKKQIKILLNKNLIEAKEELALVKLLSLRCSGNHWTS